MMVHLLINRFARKGEGHEKTDLIMQRFADWGIDVSLVQGETISEINASLRQIVTAGQQRLIVAGGDGIIHHAIQALAQSDTILGIVPIGTGNDFCRSLDYPMNIEEAIDRAMGDAVWTDLLKVGERWVASVVTFGFSGIVNTKAERLSWPKGPSRYTVATLGALPFLQSKLITFEIDGIHHELNLCLSNIANTSDFGGGMKIAPSANPFDGKANITFVSKIGRIELLLFFRRVFNGSHMNHHKVTGMEAQEIRIATEGLDLWGDGEFLGVTPEIIELVPKALLLAGYEGTL